MTKLILDCDLLMGNAKKDHLAQPYISRMVKLQWVLFLQLLPCSEILQLDKLTPLTLKAWFKNFEMDQVKIAFTDSSDCLIQEKGAIKEK